MPCGVFTLTWINGRGRIFAGHRQLLDDTPACGGGPKWAPADIYPSPSDHATACTCHAHSSQHPNQGHIHVSAGAQAVGLRLLARLLMELYVQVQPCWLRCMLDIVNHPTDSNPLVQAVGRKTQHWLFDMQSEVGFRVQGYPNPGMQPTTSKAISIGTPQT
jgi:hypothetical protein